MKKLLLLLFIPIVCFGQTFNDYDYIIIETNDYGLDIMTTATNTFEGKGFAVYNNIDDFNKTNNDLCKELTCVIKYRRGKTGFTNSKLDLSLIDCNKKVVYKVKSSNTTNFNQPDVHNNFIKSTRSIPPRDNKTTSNPIIDNEFSSELNFYSEKSIRNHFDENGTELFEGIWEYTTSGTNNYKLAIVKDDYKFVGYILEGSGIWKPGDVKAVFETAATDEIVTINWTMGNKRSNRKAVGTVKNNALIEFELSGNTILYKVYPKLSKKRRAKSGEWAGNGSGIIISKSGYIVTNYHVIEDTEEIEVEFIVDGEVQKFNAEIVQSDKVNDLAIIKIFDMNFDGLDNLPYNFKTRSSDVGTKVYAYGYPMALSLMGKEIKITDGIISSKSGFDGDITSYQITAPIQAGNSGGPLFDDRGNFIGINSAGLRKDVADNVGYTIKSSYLLNLIDVLPKSIDLPSSTKLQSLPLTEQIKEISKYVVLVKVK